MQRIAILSLFCLFFAGVLTSPVTTATGANCNIQSFRTYPQAVSYGHHQVQHHGYGHVQAAVIVNPDYYYSVNQYYQGQLILDAVKEGMKAQSQAFAEALKFGLQAPPGGALGFQQQKSRAQLLADARCVKCHNAQKATKGFDLSDLESIADKSKRRIIHSVVCSGEMPSDGAALTPEEKDVFAEYARSAK